jgi:Rad3-related DNA helicase
VLTPHDILGLNGSIARRLERYELRQEQLDMAEAVNLAFMERRHLAVEAGTGVGKSFAYLIPAILQTAGSQNNAKTTFEHPQPDNPHSAILQSDIPQSGVPKPGVLKSDVLKPSGSNFNNLNSNSKDINSNDLDFNELNSNELNSKHLESDDDDPFYGEMPTRSFEAERLDPNRELQQLAAKSTSGEPVFIPRAVISTHTISLQEQIIEKDIPFLRSVLPFEFTAVLVKGRSNYLCLRRLHAAQQKQGVLFEERRLRELQRLLDWSQETEDGSKSGLSPEPDWDIWNEICCEMGNCLGKKCLHFGQCFYAQARRRIANAQILVVNHALLFSDLAVRMQGGSILPLYHLLVFDEAHTMEQVAADHLGLSVTQGQIEYNLNRLYNPRTQRGLLTGQHLSENVSKSLIDSAQQAVDECYYSAENFFLDLESWLHQHPGGNGRVRAARIVNNGISGSIRKLNERLRDLLERIKNPDERQELRAARERMATLSGNINVWVIQGLEEESVYWLESTHSGRGRARISINAVPIDIGPILREQLFGKIPSVVMTSATLSTGK